MVRVCRSINPSIIQNKCACVADPRSRSTSLKGTPALGDGKEGEKRWALRKCLTTIICHVASVLVHPSAVFRLLSAAQKVPNPLNRPLPIGSDAQDSSTSNAWLTCMYLCPISSFIVAADNNKKYLNLLCCWCSRLVPPNQDRPSHGMRVIDQLGHCASRFGMRHPKAALGAGD